MSVKPDREQHKLLGIIGGVMQYIRRHLRGNMMINGVPALHLAMNGMKNGREQIRRSACRDIMRCCYDAAARGDPVEALEHAARAYGRVETEMERNSETG